MDTLGITPHDFWAPDINYFNGRYYLYYAASQLGVNNSVIALATNTTLDPASPHYHWVDQGLLLRSAPGDTFNAIDPNVTVDGHEVPWLCGYADGTNIGQWGWPHNDCQQFRFAPTTDGWTRIQNKFEPGGQPGKFVDAGSTCESGANVQLWSPDPQRCQQLSLQPIDNVLLVSASTSNAVGGTDCREPSRAEVRRGDASTAACQQWRFVYTDNGYFRVVSNAGQLLPVRGCQHRGSRVHLRPTAGLGECEQWRLEPLNDGTFRLVDRSSGKVAGLDDAARRHNTVLALQPWTGSASQRLQVVLP